MLIQHSSPIGKGSTEVNNVSGVIIMTKKFLVLFIKCNDTLKENMSCALDNVNTQR